MKVLVTGSAGHLGEALVRKLRDLNYEVVGVDVLSSAFTTHQGSIVDRAFVRNCLLGVSTIFHTATLHKPHVATHTRQQFVDTNVTGTLNLLEEALAAKVDSFIFTSTTSVFGDAMAPAVGAPAAWVTEDLVPIPKNIYGVTKTAAEDLCQLFYRNHGLPCIVLRTSRFFPEEDDFKDLRESFSDDNLKVNEYLFRRVEIEDAVDAHLLAAKHAQRIGFGKYIISATTPFEEKHRLDLRTKADQVVSQLVPEYKAEYQRRTWKMFSDISRIYINEKARRELGWEPQFDFKKIIRFLSEDKEPRSRLASIVGSKGYHSRKFDKGPYPV